MSNGNGHRWSKFWWCDWQNDKGLQQCSLAARGLWIELLGLCHASERPGYLLINGEAPSDTELADVLGKTNAKEITKLLGELERRRVFSRDDSGVLYSRRMVRDVVASEEGREHVAKRWRAGDPNTPPNRGPSRKPNGKANSNPTRDPFTRSLEAEEEADPPRSPPVSRGGRAARPHRNGFVELERRLKAAENAATIDGTHSEIVDFLEFTGARPKAIGGANG